MNDNFGSTHIYLKYQNKVKKLNWRKNLTSEDFSYLIKSIYGLQGKILGFQANDGTIYELSYLISHRDHISNTPYQIIVRPEQSQSRLYHHMIEMKSLKNFEEILEKLPKESLKIISIFSEIDQLFDEAMEKLENIAQDYQEEICQFYWLIISLSDRSLSKRIFSLTPPLLVFYSGEEKFLEIPINELSLHKVSKLLSRVQQEKQSSIYNIDQSDHSTTSINSFYIIEENTQRDSEFVSQETYVMDSNSSINTFELKSQTSDVDERKSTEIFDIEEKTEVNDIALQNCQFNDENIYEKEFILDGKKLDFKKKSVEPIKESYFLQPNKKTSLPPLDTSIKQENNNKILNNINGAQEEDIGSLSPCKYTDFYSLLHDNVGKFEPEDYGMAVCLYKEKNKELFDLLNDCRKLNDKDLNSFLVSNFAKKKFSLWLIDNFSRDSIEKLSNEKFFKNSGVYTAYQCFKYDNDLEDLKAMLEKALKKEDKDEILPKPTDSIVENEYSDYINNVDVDLIKKFGQDLHPIKEGSEKDEESPGMPMDYNLGVYEKKTETKYKEMVMAMKDSNLEKKADGSGFNLMLVGNGDSGLLPEKSKKKKGGLKIDCPKDEHPLARKVLEKFFDQGEMEKNVKNIFLLFC